MSPTEAIQCPECRHSNAPGALRCLKCSAPILPEGHDPQATMATQAGPWEWSQASANPSISGTALATGTVLGERYEILQLLGEGGMGAVYKARDRELDRILGLKVIRPELARNANALKRFKQELILARQITHRNVIRIFDLGVADGIKFITMEFIEGRDLSSVLEERKLPFAESAQILRQVARALEAAHGENVIHRDLKPQNIMLDAAGKVCVMDFGLARSVESIGMTQTGAMLGTPAYMSPEQALGTPVDARSDLFALGIIFYEMLTGKIPFQADTMLGSLLKRTREPAAPPSELDPEIPKVVSDITIKCLAIDPTLRYQSATDVLADLDEFLGDRVSQSRTASTLPEVSVILPAVAAPSRKRLWIAGALALVGLVATATAVWTNLRQGPRAPVKPVSLLLADFSNSTGEPVFDGTLEPMFSVVMEGASFINAYNRTAARRIGAQLQPGAAKFDESLARLVALREGIGVVVSGAIERKGGQYQVSVRAVDPASGKVLASRHTEAATKDAILNTVGKLAAPLRKTLGDLTPEAAQIAAAETYTASSLEVAHLYAQAQESQYSGRLPEAIRDYTAAVQLDPKFGRAFAGLAVANMNLKKQAEAGEYYKQALALMDRMSEREKYRTLGAYYLSYVRNYGQAIETLKKLVSLYPADGAGHNNLAVAYAFSGDMQEAVRAAKQALDLSPHNLQRRFNYAAHSMYAGDFQTASAEAEKILKDNPKFEFAYLPRALSALVQGDVKQARDVYSRLAAISPAGDSLAKMGEGDLNMYLGAFKGSIVPLTTGIAADEKVQNAGEMANKYIALAEAQLAMGDRTQAAKSASKAAELSQLEGIQYLAARVLVQAGDEGKARALAGKLENLLQSQTRSYARMIKAEIALRHHQFPEAVDELREAQKLRNSWIVHFLLGQTYTEAGHFPEALAELDICNKRQGESADLFFVQMITFRYLPPLYYWTGRAQEGMGSKDAARTGYQEFLKRRAEADAGDLLAADAKRRLAKL